MVLEDRVRARRAQTRLPDGEIVFALGRVAVGSYPWIGTYRAESPSGPITSIVRAGMPASEALTITEPGGFAPAINGRGDVALGESGLVAELEDGETAAYRLDAESRLSLILKSGSATDAGPVTRVGSQHRNNATAPACSLNARGEVALIVQISGGPDTIVLLTPKQR
jgi:hypothetical protein